MKKPFWQQHEDDLLAKQAIRTLFFLGIIVLFGLFLLLLTSCNQQHICYAKIEAETESKLARYRHDLIMNEINFREFERLRDSALALEKMKKIKCQ